LLYHSQKALEVIRRDPLLHNFEELPAVDRLGLLLKSGWVHLKRRVRSSVDNLHIDILLLLSRTTQAKADLIRVRLHLKPIASRQLIEVKEGLHAI